MVRFEWRDLRLERCHGRDNAGLKAEASSFQSDCPAQEPRRGQGE